MKKNYLAALCGAAAFLFPVLAGAQCTLCGTGADSIYEATSNVQLPGAVYNFTSFTIDTGVTVTVTGPQPLVIYCSGAVNIQGTITVKGDDGSPGITSSMAGAGGLGVAGGQQGGDGVYSASVGPLDGVAGSGAGSGGAGMQWSGGGGGGYSTYGDTAGTNGGFGGSPYGNAQINPYDAGSGGGGGSGGYACGGGGGGAGGGYISISSCNGIIIGASGMIDARGGNGGSDGTGNCGGG
ncbi:MAG TPA: hypothetical protein VFU15_10985, partial [Bacteroidia bacterium]|nr:hypothetical protein [Bacteroidia bacterium]